MQNIDLNYECRLNNHIVVAVLLLVKIQYQSFLSLDFQLSLELKLTEWGLRPSGVKHRTSTEQRETPPTEPEVQHVNNGNANPSMEETVNLINNRLKESRRELGLPEAIKVGTREPQQEAGTEDHSCCPGVCRTCPMSR